MDLANREGKALLQGERALEPSWGGPWVPPRHFSHGFPQAWRMESDYCTRSSGCAQCLRETTARGGVSTGRSVTAEPWGTSLPVCLARARPVGFCGLCGAQARWNPPHTTGSCRSRALQGLQVHGGCGGLPPPLKGGGVGGWLFQASCFLQDGKPLRRTGTQTAASRVYGISLNPGDFNTEDFLILFAIPWRINLGPSQ